MERSEQIRSAFKKMAEKVGPAPTLLALVRTVNEANDVCELVDDDELVYSDVRLRPVVDGNQSVTLVPKVNTWALAVRLENEDEWMMIACGEVEKIKITCDKVVINDGTNGGLVKWPSAKAQHDLVKQFIMAVKNACSTPVTEPGNGAPSAFQAALNASLTIIQTPNFDNLEDTKVKH
jgi:hypothetical protein